jgi:hypothetical protein
MEASPWVHDTTIEELELKMKDLELRFLGREVPQPELSPFTPHTTLERRINNLKETLKTTSSKVSAKLPPIPLPSFDGSDLDTFLKDFERWLRLSGVEGCSEAFQLDWLIQCSTSKVKKIVEKVVEENKSLELALLSLAELFPRLENDLTLRESLERLPPLPYGPEPSQVKKLLVEFAEVTSRMTRGALGDQERYLMFSRKLHPKTFSELRADRHYRRRTETFDDLKLAVLEKSQEDWLEKALQKKVTLHTLQESPLSMTQSPAHADTEIAPPAHKPEGGPFRGKGKGKGRGSHGKGGVSSGFSSVKGGFGPKGSSGKGFGNAKGQGKGASEPPHFQVTVFCKFCNRKGHYEDQCWSKAKVERKSKALEKSQSQAVREDHGVGEKKRKLEAIHFFKGTSLTTEVTINGKTLMAIIDSGATTSAIAKHCVPDGAVLRQSVVPIQVGNGETVFSEGQAVLNLQFGDCRLEQMALVVPTSAFEAVLGMDFLTNPKVGGLLTQPAPCRLLVDGKTYPLSEHKASQIHRIYRLYKRESYTLVKDVKAEVLQKLDINPVRLTIDLFANHKNAQEVLYCTRENSAFFYDWSSLIPSTSSLLWANPPFSQLDRVLTKVAMESVQIVIVTPDWGDCPWRQLLEKLSVSQVQVPSGMSLYQADGCAKTLPPPSWNTLVSFLDSKTVKVPRHELDSHLVKWVERKSRGWSLEKLQEEVKRYPRCPSFESGMEREVQTESCDGAVFFDGEDLSPPVSPISVVSQDFFMHMAADLSLEVDLEFTKKDHLTPMVAPSVEDLPFDEVLEPIVDTRAKPTSTIVASKEDLKIMSLDLLQHLPVVSTSGPTQLFKETENLHGDLQKDLSKFDDDPMLKSLFVKFSDVFGPLPPPGKGCAIVECDLELKEENKGQTIRGKCWNMNVEDAEEIQRQVDELVQNGLLEPYPKGKTPLHCSPTFLVEKKESASKRMVVHFKKVNALCKSHSGFLPSMEGMIECLASCKYKSKLDLRSGFWQVSMSERAKELTSMVTPNGMVYRWNVMPFGLQVAPAIFQQMMERIIQEVKMNPKVSKLLSPSTDGRIGKAFLGAFFDDVGVGAETIEDHLFILEEFFKVVQKHSLRIKLSKCDFLKLKMEYLGFEVSWGSWRPSQSKVQAIQSFKVRSLKDLRSFLGACNFFRRHVKNFTYSTASLTDLLKKNARFHWSSKEEALVSEIKQKLLTTTPLGVPRSSGEMVIVTDASDQGGGGTLLQWQAMDPQQVPSSFSTQGMARDGSIIHNYPDNFRLVPLGYWNWKWCPTRGRYSTFEQELLAGVLIFSSQCRIIQHLPLVWFCDHEALKYFLDKEPPLNARLRRWFLFLSQFKIKFHHTPGMKNELCDWLSRTTFDQKYGLEFENLAKEAFQKMDSQLDLSLQVLSMEVKEFDLPLSYESSEFSHVWCELDQWKTGVFDDNLWFKSQDKLFCERKLAVPKEMVPKICLWLHQKHGHPGAERTLLSFLKSFHSSLTRKELLGLFQNVLVSCSPCLLSKPSTSKDRGLMGCLPVPPLCNDIIYLDFVALDEFNSFDYALGIVDALSRFSIYLPCKKEISGEGVFKMIMKEWVQKYGRPNEVWSDNDVRFKSPTGFYQEAMKKLGVKVTFSLPRNPRSNGLMERENRSFVQNLRCLVQESGSKDWPKLLPMVNFVMNSQISSVTGFCPSELFQGRLPWRFECSSEPTESPQVEAWVMEQLFLQEKACLRVKHLRSVAQKRKNKWRSPTSYFVGEWVLIHKSRWPQKRVEKIDSPWFGPYKVVQVAFNSLMVLTSPSLGGLVKVSLSQVKHWSSVHDPHSDGLICVEENEESGDDPASARLAESSLVSQPVDQEGRAGREGQSAGDAQGRRRREHEDEGPEQEARAARSRRTTRTTRREGRSAGDQAPETDDKEGSQAGFGGIPVVFPVPDGSSSPEERAAVVDREEAEVQVVVPLASGQVQECTVEEAQQRGYFNVEKVLAHKFKYGAWRFLVKWEGFPISSASWEPMKCFQLPGGRINTVFAEYVQVNGLQDVLGMSEGRRIPNPEKRNF